jgi:hypothetical protein
MRMTKNSNLLLKRSKDQLIGNLVIGSGSNRSNSENNKQQSNAHQHNVGSTDDFVVFMRSE